ncbi:hypothetical protein ACLB2K_072422 [Fragaria x ananassa]
MKKKYKPVDVVRIGEPLREPNGGMSRDQPSCRWIGRWNSSASEWMGTSFGSIAVVVVVEHLDRPDSDCWPSVRRTRKDRVIDQTSPSFTFGRCQRLLSASSCCRPRHLVAVVDVFCSGVEIKIGKVALTPLDRRRRRPILAMMRRDQPCCSSKKACLSTKMLRLSVLIQRFRHGDQRKEKIITAAHGMVSIVMKRQCLGPGLENLNLANNSFHGILPQRFTTAGCDLSMIDVSHNKLQGQLPRSLANCASLEFLVLSNNQFDDVFPLWLGTLQKLKILAMRHNGFYGVIGQPKKNLHFPELRILDLSYNSFKEINYPKIQEDRVAIHLSGNKFEGNIPEFIGKLKGLRLLNISNNFFTGCIPSSFGNLTVLESLDLSENQLSGVIPQQLSRLSFLEKFNVSHNSLTGRIPGGTQLSTFEVTSFEGNPGLCGDQLPKKCENREVADNTVAICKVI